MTAVAIQKSPVKEADLLGNATALVKDELAKIDELMLDGLDEKTSLIPLITKHLLENCGKRIRPLITLLCARAAGYTGQKHPILAASIEFFHTSTLLHDDVVDESTLRRGQATANQMWGNKAAILVGDFLFSRSFQLTVQLENQAILNEIAIAANAITQGEVRQLSNMGNASLTEEEYFQIIQDKTATLFKAAAKTGAMLSDDQMWASDLSDYGYHLGMAFQLIDDVLDYVSNGKEMGKNPGDDLEEGKMTLPLIHLMANGEPSHANLIKESLRAKSKKQLNDILQAMQTAGSVAYSEKVAKDHIEKAIAAAQRLPETPYKDALLGLAKFSLTRIY